MPFFHLLYLICYLLSHVCDSCYFSHATCTQGIGDSGQGLLNAILFVILTKQVRDSYLRLCCCCKKDKGNKEKTNSTAPQETSGGVNIDESGPSIHSDPFTPLND